MLWILNQSTWTTILYLLVLNINTLIVMYQDEVNASYYSNPHASKFAKLWRWTSAKSVQWPLHRHKDFINNHARHNNANGRQVSYDDEPHSYRSTRWLAYAYQALFCQLLELMEIFHKHHHYQSDFPHLMFIWAHYMVIKAPQLLCSQFSVNGYHTWSM